MTNLADIGRHDAEAVNSAESRHLYEARQKIFPKAADGLFRRLKWWIMAATLAIYYITPWLRWDRGPYAPDQAVLVDLVHRRFYFFFIEIWPQEFYYVAGMLVMAGIGLFLVTSTMGRAWCGYTCPQTVWVDLFLVVERFFEGDRNAQIRLDKADWSTEKIRKRLLKHTTWLVIAVATGGAWIFYFADAPTLAVDFATGQAPFMAYATVAVLTFITYVFGGLMREQVCTYMCPWPRIQGAMLDEDSLTVTYNDWRGEPRGRHARKAAAAGQLVGDCVDCNACVAVCPMGIDIRDGQQLECITCALCIDACDSVMDKLGRERGLISYATLRDYNANCSITAGDAWISGTVGADQIARTTWQSVIRPRTLLYTGLWSLIGLAMLFVLATRDRLDINVIHDRNPVFVQLTDGSIRNGYTIKVLNMLARPRHVTLAVEGLPGGEISLAGATVSSGNIVFLEIEPDKLRAIKVYLSVKREDLTRTSTPFRFIVRDADGIETRTYTASFEAPEGSS